MVDNYLPFFDMDEEIGKLPGKDVEGQLDKICARVCPANNITVTEDKVMFGDRCEVCYACLHNCPKKAIHLPVEKAGARFRNEHVSLNDIIRSNE